MSKINDHRYSPVSNHNKNLRRVSVVITAQTHYNLCKLAANMGYNEKNIGRVIDKLTRNHMISLENDHL